MTFRTIQLVTLIACFLSPYDVKAFKSAIYNFTEQKIYYSLPETNQRIKISVFDKKTLYYQEPNVTLIISKHTKPDCKIQVNNRQDLFVTQKNDKLICTPRVERLPKEF